MTFWQQPNDSANQYGPNNDYPISLHRVNHKTFATLQNGSVDPKKLQSPKFICIDDILAFATYINVHDIDIFLRRNRNAHYKHIRISALALYSSDIELVVRKEDSTSNRRLSSLNFNLSLSLSLRCSANCVRKQK